MSAPYIGTTITLSSLQVQWDALTGTATGGADIDSYNLEYDQGTNTWIDVQGDDGSF